MNCQRIFQHSLMFRILKDLNLDLTTKTCLEPEFKSKNTLNRTENHNTNQTLEFVNRYNYSCFHRYSVRPTNDVRCYTCC